MEGITKCKELEYLNMAVNNISLVEGIRNCESLQKMDLTLNFVDIEDFEESVDNLAELPDIREIHFLGNPCTDWEHWKDYVMARLPTLGRVDGTDVTKTMRMAAIQKFDWLEKDLVIQSRKRIEKKIFDETQPKNENAYSKEFRRECYLEDKQKKEDQEAASKENSMFKEYNEFEKLWEKKEIPVYSKDGTVRQANEGKYEWRFDET